jgi:hypothetical protein
VYKIVARGVLSSSANRVSHHPAATVYAKLAITVSFYCSDYTTVFPLGSIDETSMHLLTVWLCSLIDTVDKLRAVMRSALRIKLLNKLRLLAGTRQDFIVKDCSDTQEMRSHNARAPL